MMVPDLEAIKSVKIAVDLEIRRPFKPGWEMGRGLQRSSAEALLLSFSLRTTCKEVDLAVVSNLQMGTLRSRKWGGVT